MATVGQKQLRPTAIEINSASPILESSSDLLGSLEDHEDVISWINDVLGVSEEPSDAERPAALTELDRRVSHLVGTLEIASEDTSAQVDRLIEDISRGASRLTYDLHFMRESAVSLQGVLASVELKSKPSLGVNTDAALQRLHHLDTVKRNMEATREVLREAESWSTLESDVTSLLGEKNYEKAAERLSEASKSMVVFENTPEYESRRTLMVSLQNQLEASLSSALVAAVNSQDVAVCRNYFSIFTNIQRESEFRNYYYGSRRGPLVEEWQHAPLRDCDQSLSAETAAITLASFLPSFYSSFQKILQNERSSVPAIFPDPRPTLSALITSTLSALQPSFSQRLEALSTHYGAVALPQLIAAYRATEDFAAATEKIMEKVSYAAPVSSDDRPGGHLRRRSSARMSLSLARRVGSHRASISGTGTLAPPALDWDQELFEPFVDFQADYATLETRFIEDAVKTALAADSRGRVDYARLLRERAVDIFGVAEDAIARCAAFTHGYGALALLQSLDHLFTTFANSSKADVASRRSAQGGQSLSTSSGEDLSDLDYTADDWADIQALLHFLEAVRALLDRMVMFEAKLRSNLVQVSTSLRQARNDPGGLFVSGGSGGKLQLLMQSTLNSTELQELLNKVDPEPPVPQTARGETFLTPAPPTPDPRRSPHMFATVPASLAPPPPLLTGGRSAISELARTCQQALQDTILSPLHKYLASYASSPLWSTPGDPKAKRSIASGNALSEVQVPTFSLSPSNTMQHVAEGLLNLPRLFEVYADDDALAFSLETLPSISADILRGLVEPAPVLEPSITSSGISHTRRAPSLSVKASAVPPGPAPPVVAPILTPEAVSAAWLSSLGLSLVSRLTSDVLPRISRLTPAGAAQLSSDLAYLSNIVMALNVESPELEKWREWVDVDDTDGRQKLKEAREALAPGEKEDLVMATIVRLRGWV
uniref:Conserved oligomeric Golgi complex subunit 7 n=1 Tax=Ganoderma boninense TaxID=34458 RepID=A0A5K1K5F6_9APHY|nr:Minor allergen Alt a 7 [Ganoderma boninense]